MGYRKLGRRSDHRRSMLRNMTTSLLREVLLLLYLFINLLSAINENNDVMKNTVCRSPPEDLTIELNNL